MRPNALVLPAVTLILVAGINACSNSHAYGGGGESTMPDGEYRKVSELVELPEFIPGMGTLYVQPDTLPAGPFLAYDRDGEHVSTVYMIPLEDMNANGNWKALAAKDRVVKSVDVTYNPGHPGVNEPHYHVTLWHVARGSADLE